MKILYLTAMILSHILVSSVILYFSVASATPVVDPESHHPVVASKIVAPVAKPQEVTAQNVPNVVAAGAPTHYRAAVDSPRKDTIVEKEQLAQKSIVKVKEVNSMVVPEKSYSSEGGKPTKYIDQQQISPVQIKEEKTVSSVEKHEQPAVVVASPPVISSVGSIKSIEEKVEHPKPVYESPKSITQVIPSLEDSVKEKLVAEPDHAQPKEHIHQQAQPVVEIKESKGSHFAASIQPLPVRPAPVKGGLGPLHLLSTAVCNYQPEDYTDNETLKQLYRQRAAQRKNLFQFMNLKFPNLPLERIAEDLGPDFSPSVQPSEKSTTRSRAWPAVGNCTSHYFKLMAEASWCDCAEEPNCVRDAPEAKVQSSSRSGSASARSIEEQTAAVSGKIVKSADVREASMIDGSQRSNSTRQCRRNALKLTKALFNHLAEDQTEVSESWPKLYAEISSDECARRRMTDVVTALSNFRGESTQVHRDNIEFAFAMDDLRGKVLENEVNTPLTFDKQVIEVEQFLQQSVRLMLANIDPKRAKLTSMRYRSLHAPVSADDQCIELHQRLLTKNYPEECNPNEYGPLPDVLRMAAYGLDLWSIESEIAKYPQNNLYQPTPCALALRKRNQEECTASILAN